MTTQAQALADAQAVVAYLETLQPAPPAQPSGFAHPDVPSGMTEILWEDFTSTNTYGKGSGVNAEGALWSPGHVTFANSVATIAAYQDPGIVGQYGITSANATAVNNWVAGQFGVGTIQASTFRVLTSMRADKLAGLTNLALLTGINAWPPEIDIVELNANEVNAATLHYGSGPPNPPGFYPYFQTACDLTKWMVWGVSVNPTTINFLVQTSPTGTLSTWASHANPDPNGPNSFSQPMYLALQQQTNDAIYSSGTPNFPVNSPSVTAANPIKQQHDWVQICTG